MAAINAPAQGVGIVMHYQGQVLCLMRPGFQKSAALSTACHCIGRACICHPCDPYRSRGKWPRRSSRQVLKGGRASSETHILPGARTRGFPAFPLAPPVRGTVDRCGFPPASFPRGLGPERRLPPHSQRGAKHVHRQVKFSPRIKSSQPISWTYLPLCFVYRPVILQL